MAMSPTPLKLALIVGTICNTNL